MLAILILVLLLIRLLGIVAIMWDCDDTLVLSEHKAFTACANLLIKELNRRHIEHSFTTESLMQKFRGKSFKSILKDLDLQLSDDEIAVLVAKEVEAVMARFEQVGLEVTPGVVFMIKLLRALGFRQAVVSSSALRRVKLALELTFLTQYFECDEVFSAADLGVSKPDPLVCAKAARQMGLSLRSCIGIEDSGNGVKAWINAGIRVVGYTGSVPKSERAAHTEKLVNAGAYATFSNMRQLPFALLKAALMPIKSIPSA